ncbi:MAG: DUF4230 domain-containing protein [Treponema sp.]|nr:DUF4230 domain-containing protein [Candidatus Treponema merdequi]
MKQITKILFKILFFLIILSGISFGTFFGIKKFKEVKTEKLYATVSKTITQAAELCLYKMNYTDIIIVKKSTAMGLAKSYSIVKYSGIIRAGIRNIDDINFEISDDHNKITLTVPPSELLGNDIVSQTVFDEHKNIFVPISTQEIFDEIETAKDDAAKEILAEGFLDDADKRAVSYISNLLSALGFENVVVNQL